MLALHGEQSGAELDGRAAKFQPVLDALNVLGRTAWRINEDVLRVMEEVWATGGGRGDVPPRENVPDPTWPANPYGLRRSRGQLAATALPSRQDVAGFIHSLNRTKQRNRELHSQRCDFLIKLQVAKEMRDEDRIYFPHNIDFRGRAYTMHVHLNHLGSDICRGALVFADARPLGDDGLDWLYIQAANLYAGGVDKLPMDERRQWIEDRVHLLEQSARDPLGPDGVSGSTPRTRGSAWRVASRLNELEPPVTRPRTCADSPSTRTAAATACSTTRRSDVTRLAASRST